MKAQPKQPRRVCFSGGFDARIKDAIGKIKGAPYSEKLKLYQAIIEVCRIQVEDCCDGITASMYLALHEQFGFGQKRVNRLQNATQTTLDAYVDKYDIGTLPALYRDLKAHNIIINPREKGE